MIIYLFKLAISEPLFEIYRNSMAVFLFKYICILYLFIYLCNFESKKKCSQIPLGA